MIAGKTVVLGVTGGIAAYKAADLVSRLKKMDLKVFVVMTQSATEFITPLTLETLSGNRVVVDTFDRSFPWEVEHIALAKRADGFAIAPATANVLGKMAHGIADDMLTTTVMATKAPLVLAPAMNTGMYENPVVQENIRLLRGRGAQIVEPAVGLLACGDTGKGKMADPAEIAEAIERALTPQDLAGKRVLVTAGPTREAMDPVRFLSNHSTGKMGYALARQAWLRGAQTTLVSGPTALTPPVGVETVPVTSALDMRQAVLDRLDTTDWFIKAAAVGDYRPAHQADQKLKKQDGDLQVQLTRNPDILAELGGKKRPGQLLCGFSMETQDLLDNSRKKLQSKHCDLMVANNLKTAGAGFAHDTNVATLLYPDGRTEPLSLMEKRALADCVLDRLLDLSRG